MGDIEFTETTGTLARKARRSPDTIRRLANEGLLEFRRLPGGTRLFRTDAVERVKALVAERMARCGRHERKTAAA